MSLRASTSRRGADAVVRDPNGPSAGRVETHHGEKGDLWDHDAPAQPDDGDLAASDELIGEGPRDPEQLSGFSNGVDQALAGETL